MTTKTALITGIAGQDGSFLAELLLDKSYEVHGIVRRSSSRNTDRIDHQYEDPHESDTRLHLHYGDLGDSTSLVTILRQVEPEELYHLGTLVDADVQAIEYGASGSTAALRKEAA